MERQFGADFDGVRVHNDARSDELNEQIQAKAFTVGRDIFFRQGQYEPESQPGQEPIAHELTHVIQQTGPGHPAPEGEPVQRREDPESGREDPENGARADADGGSALDSRRL